MAHVIRSRKVFDLLVLKITKVLQVLRVYNKKTQSWDRLYVTALPEGI